MKIEPKGNYKMKMEFAEKTAMISISLTAKLTILLAHNALLMRKISGTLFVTYLVTARNAHFTSMQI